MGLCKPKETGLYTIRKQNVEKRDQGIDLGVGVRFLGRIQLKGQQADSKIEKAAENSGYSVPNGLTSEFSDSAQRQDFFSGFKAELKIKGSVLMLLIRLINGFNFLIHTYENP